MDSTIISGFDLKLILLPTSSAFRYNSSQEDYENLWWQIEKFPFLIELYYKNWNDLKNRKGVWNDNTAITSHSFQNEWWLSKNGSKEAFMFFPKKAKRVKYFWTIMMCLLTASWTMAQLQIKFCRLRGYNRRGQCNYRVCLFIFGIWISCQR